MPWPGYLIDGASGVTIAADTDGNGVWEYINMLYNSNFNSFPDIQIANNGGYNLVYRKFVPITAEGGETDKTTLKFMGIGNAAFYCSVEETTIAAYKGAVTKSLWLHGNNPATQAPAGHINSLTTVTDTAGTGTGGLSYTQVARYASAVWSMSPVLHRDLKVTGNIRVNLVLTDNNVTNSATVTLFYTNGQKSYLIGERASGNIRRGNSNTRTAFDTFTITPSLPLVIPAGYKLAVLFNNRGTGNTYFRVYHNSLQISNVSMSVSDYVGVDWIKAYDAFGVTSNAYVAGENLKISAQVSDPFGAYAVANARIAIYNPSGVTQVAGTTLMTYDNTDSASVPGYKQYYYNYTIPASPETGMWSAVVEGEEDNGVRSTRVYNFYVRAPDHIQLNPVNTIIPAGNEALIKSQVVDIQGNSLNSPQLITVTVNGSAVFSSAPAGWTGEGTNTIYGNTDSRGYAEFKVRSFDPENVTVTPSCALPGSPGNNTNSYIWFTPPHHASASVTDGIAAAGGTGEPVRIWIEDIYGNAVASSQFITVTLDNGGYFSSVPAGWSGAGTSTAFGFTNTSGYEDLTVQKNSPGNVKVMPDSTSWGFPAFDEGADINFVLPGEYHIEVVDAGSGTLTASNVRVLNIKVM
ncbi:MAG TPA: hypothetical protein PKZ78_10785, partial [Candidatus Goldiibacteriota bacterium]|nr:hypothetical protein [Candidatus Goldiibacteriota bacterium]